jgi:hypothetical protein
VEAGSGRLVLQRREIPTGVTIYRTAVGILIYIGDFIPHGHGFATSITLT